MTAARDELAELIRNTDAWMLGYEHDLADAIIAAGWRPPKPKTGLPKLTYAEAAERAHRLSGW